MLSIVIPAYNEESRLPNCLIETVKFLSGVSPEYEIIVVCDGCTDKTAEITHTFSTKFDFIKVIDYTPNRGKGYAVKKGVMHSKYDLILYMDADYAVPISTVLNFIDESKKGFDIVMGARGLKDTVILKRQMFLRELAGKVFGKIQKRVLGIPYYDTQCGFKLLTRKAAHFLFEKITYDCSYFDAELIYIAHKFGMNIKEMPVIWKHDGATRMPIGYKRTIDLLKKLFRLKSLHIADIINNND